MTKRAIVIGAGVGGLTAGAALHRRGWDVRVYEKAPALEAVGAGIAMAPNALKALDTIGVGEPVRQLGAIQGDVGIARPDGRWLSRTSAEFAAARFGDPTVVVLRSVLVDLLAGALPAGALRLGVPATLVDDGRVRAGDDDLDADLVVAADGLRSPTRQALLPGYPGPVYSGVTSWRLLAPATTLDRAGETWGRGLVFGIVPLAGDRIYCYATAVTPAGVTAADERAELLRLFGDWHRPVPQLITTADTVLRTDIFYLDEPLPRFDFGRTVLLGDAAHGMTPNLGQGGCQAIEDAVVLAAYADDPARYTAERLARTSAVAKQSRRIGRTTMISNRIGVWLRDNAMSLAGRLGPNVVIRQADPVLGWRPPA